MKKIVVLDARAALGGDLNFDALKAYGALEIYDRTPPERTKERLEGAFAAFTNKTALDRPLIEGARQLKYIGVLATGYNVVDLRAASERGIVVANVPAYSSASVAQHAAALLLELCMRAGLHSDGVKSGRWAASPDFSYCERPLIELEGKTAGIIGYGDIGRRTARIFSALGMKILAVKRKSSAEDATAEFVGLEQLLASSDVVSLSCPLTAETSKLINEKTLAGFKRGALLINTSRGPVVDEAAVAAALASGRLGGFAADVLENEPPRGGSPLFAFDNCVITPHLAWATAESRARLVAAAIANFEAFLNGAPQNAVNAGD